MARLKVIQALAGSIDGMLLDSVNVKNVLYYNMCGILQKLSALRFRLWVRGKSVFSAEDKGQAIAALPYPPCQHST